MSVELGMYKLNVNLNKINTLRDFIKFYEWNQTENHHEFLQTLEKINHFSKTIKNNCFVEKKCNVFNTICNLILKYFSF